MISEHSTREITAPRLHFPARRDYGARIVLLEHGMRLAVLKERRAGESRVAATPETVKKLKAMGLGVAVEAGAGLASGMSREAAGEFSFLLAIPAVAGALVLELKDFGELAGAVPAGALAVGSIAAFLAGLAALLLLLPLVRKGKLAWFAAYLVPAGILGLILL